MKRTQKGSTLRQYAYATRRLSPGQATSKKEIALLSGFSKSVAENIKAKVEDTVGYQNAVIVLAAESNNMLLAVLAEFKARGLTNFSNKDLNSALNAISGAWDRINKQREPDKIRTPEGNPLRAVLMKRVETTTATIEEVPHKNATPVEPTDVETKDVKTEPSTADLDF